MRLPRSRLRPLVGCPLRGCPTRACQPNTLDCVKQKAFTVATSASILLALCQYGLHCAPEMGTEHCEVSSSHHQSGLEDKGIGLQPYTKHSQVLYDLDAGVASADCLRRSLRGRLRPFLCKNEVQCFLGLLIMGNLLVKVASFIQTVVPLPSTAPI